MSNIIFGSARIDENGKEYGGAAGDQKQTEAPDFKGEVSMEGWYNHPLGWYVFRANDPEAREKIAENMRAACNNKNVGYNQHANQTLYQAASKVGFDISKVTAPCNTDCARLTRVCVLYAGINCADFYTATEPAALQQTGAFTWFKDEEHCAKPDLLLKGDILVTRSKGHSVVVVDGPTVSREAPYGYIRTLASVHIRKAPRLDGESLSIVSRDNVFIFTGCQGIDTRGKLWYEVVINHKNGYGWISSTYARREET